MPSNKKLIKDKYFFEKRYSVFIGVSDNADGYVFINPKKANSKSYPYYFVLRFYFKAMSGKKRNPIFVVDKLEGNDFEGRLSVINHFSKNHAIQYSFMIDSTE